MSTKATPVLIVLVSVVLSVGLSSLLGSKRAGESRAATTLAQAPLDVQALEQRLAELERRLDELGPVLVAAEVPSEAAPPSAQRTDLTVDSAEQSALDGRIAALERLLAQFESPERDSPREKARREQAERLEREEAIRTAQSILANPASPVAEMLVAHETLRRVADAYTPTMVQALVQIGTSDPDSDTRARVWCNFDGSSHLPELVPHLLRALSTDPEPRVRDEASETLGNYLDDPDVLAAVKYAAEFDVSARVRQKAVRTLQESGALVTER